MKTTTLLISLAALTTTGSSLWAQTALSASGAESRIETLSDNIADDFERDTTGFGSEGRATGLSGSFALQSSATTGNTDVVSVGLGANLGYYDGTNGYDVQLSYQYAEDDGEVSEDSLLYELEYTRDLAPSYFAFAKMQGSVDTLPFDTSDNFVGVGLGYRIYNTVDTQWTVSAGLGYRIADFDGAEDFDEGALSISSSYYNKLTDSLAVTNDTDIIGSDFDTVLYNDLGLNVSMTDTLALRTSVVTEYHTDPAAGREDTDNTFGLSVVYSFN